MASPFDPNDVVSPATTSPFDEEDVVAAPAPAREAAAASPFDAADLAAPGEAELPDIKPRDDTDFTVNGGELEEIAGRRGVSPADLAEWVPLYGGTVQQDKNFSWGQVPAAAAARTASLLTGGMAPDLVKRLAVENPQMRAALDDVEQLLSDKRGYTGKTVDFLSEAGTSVAGGSALFKGATKLAGVAPKVGAEASKLYKAAELGAEVAGLGAQSVVQAREGEEMEDLALNTALYIGLRGLGKGISATRKKATDRAIRQLSETLAEKNTVEVVETIMREQAPAEAALAKAVMSGVKKPKELLKVLSMDEVDQIAALAEFGEVVPSDTATSVAKKMLGFDNPNVEKLAKVLSYVSEQRRKLGRRLGTGSSRTRGLDEAIAQQQPEHVEKVFTGLRKGEHALNHLRDSGLDQSTAEGRKLGAIGPLRRAAIFLSDARHVYDAISNRYGLELTPIIDRASSRHNAYMTEAALLQQKLRPLIKQSRKLGLKTEDMWEALNRGEFPLEKFSPEQQEVLRGWKAFYDEAADTIENVHLNYEDLDISPIRISRKRAGPEGSYITHMAVKGPEYVARVNHKMKQLGTQDPREIFEQATRGDADAKDVIAALEYWTGKDIMDPRSAVAAMNDLHVVGPGVENQRSAARALFKRGEEIPDFLLEKDPAKLANGWIQNTMRHAFLRDSFDEMSQAAQVVKGVSPVLGDYIQNHVRDLTGVRPRTPAGIVNRLQQQLTASMEEKALAHKEVGNNKQAAFYKLMAQHDDIARAASGNMYAYFLGLRPDAALRNLSQPLFMTAPHISGGNPADAARRVGNGYRRALYDMATNREEVLAQLKSRGQLPTEAMQEAERWLEKGMGQVDDPAFLAALKDGNHALSKLAMTWYRSSDAFNRVVTKHIADDIISDAFKFADGVDTPATRNALLSIQGASPGYRSMLERHLRQGRTAMLAARNATDDVARQAAENTAEQAYTAAQQAMEDYLLSHTQFNYNKASMSEYGRAMGGLFSMFSKWPTSFVGETLFGALDARAIGKAMPNNETKLVWKYLAPTMLAWWAQEAFWEENVKKSDTVPAKIARTVAGRDLRAWTPGDTVRGLVRGEIGKAPPALKAVGNFVSGMAEGDPVKAIKGVAEQTVPQLPFMYMTKLVTPFLDEND